MGNVAKKKYVGLVEKTHSKRDNTLIEFALGKYV